MCTRREAIFASACYRGIDQWWVPCVAYLIGAYFSRGLIVPLGGVALKSYDTKWAHRWGVGIVIVIVIVAWLVVGASRLRFVGKELFRNVFAKSLIALYVFAGWIYLETSCRQRRLEYAQYPAPQVRPIPKLASKLATLEPVLLCCYVYIPVSFCFS